MSAEPLPFTVSQAEGDTYDPKTFDYCIVARSEVGPLCLPKRGWEVRSEVSGATVPLVVLRRPRELIEL